MEGVVFDKILGRIREGNNGGGGGSGSIILPVGSIFGGVVGPNDEPPYSNDHRYFYLALQEGRYINFNNWVVSDYVSLLYWDDVLENWTMLALWPNDDQLSDIFSSKANKASGATSGHLAGLDAEGNLTDSGIAASDVATNIPVINASVIPAGMDANKVYQYGTLAVNTTFPSLNAPTDATKAHIYCWTFATSSTPPTITWPSGITAWAGGNAPTINANTMYEVSVMDGLACIVESQKTEDNS